MKFNSIDNRIIHIFSENMDNYYDAFETDDWDDAENFVLEHCRNAIYKKEWYFDMMNNAEIKFIGRKEMDKSKNSSPLRRLF